MFLIIALQRSLILLCAQAMAADVTFTRDVAPIFYRRCVACHRPGEVAPMSLQDYKSARPWARSILEAARGGKMPPWLSDPHWGQFANDARLPPSEILCD